MATDLRGYRRSVKPKSNEYVTEMIDASQLN